MDKRGRPRKKKRGRGRPRKEDIPKVNFTVSIENSSDEMLVLEYFNEVGDPRLWNKLSVEPNGSRTISLVLPTPHDTTHIRIARL